MHVVKTGVMKDTCCDHLNPQAKCAWKLQIFHCHWFYGIQGGRCMEEFMFPVAIPHTGVRTDKEILFLGRYLSVFFITSPKHFTVFLSLLLKVCCRQDKTFSLQGIPSDNLSQGVPMQSFSVTGALPSLQGSQTPCASHYCNTKPRLTGLVTEALSAFRWLPAAENRTSKCDLVNQAFLYSQCKRK